MSERVAIIGSRDYPDEEAVREYVRLLPYDTTVISGGARGVDAWAEGEARKRGLAVEVYDADWELYGKAAGFIRNERIVDKCSRLVAFWDGESRGTRDSIEKAFLAGVPVDVLLPPEASK